MTPLNWYSWNHLPGKRLLVLPWLFYGKEINHNIAEILAYVCFVVTLCFIPKISLIRPLKQDVFYANAWLNSTLGFIINQKLGNDDDKYLICISLILSLLGPICGFA
jgi:hypothetical protein